MWTQCAIVKVAMDVRNQQLYILRMYCKSCISFNFSVLLIIYTTYCKKKLHAFTENEIIGLTIFLFTSYSFHHER